MNQKEALDILKLGHNIYLTGSAGSGKTFLLNEYINYLSKHGVDLGITASTGIAATHIKGITIHSWSGLGIRDKLSKSDLREIVRKRYLAKRVMAAKVLIIDEVSMLHDYHLDLVNRVCQAFRGSPEPFGGLQVVLCGDFFQLPPVGRNGQEVRFIPDSETWYNMDLKVCYLDEQHRHEDDQLIKILNEIRTDQVSNETLKLLMSRCDKSVGGYSDLTKLYTHNIDVDNINNQKLRTLPGVAHLYRMRGSGYKPIVEVLKNSCLAPEKLYLKRGAVVMFVKNNYELGYVNGTLGQVVDFDEDGLPIVETTDKRRIVVAATSWTIEEDGHVKAEIVQIPLRLAWAITVHKSQGMSLDAAEIDLGKSFEPGMGYVALSRVRSLKGMNLKGFNEMALQVSQGILELDKELIGMSGQAQSALGKMNQEEKEEKQKRYLQTIMPTKKDLEKKIRKKPGATFEETKTLVQKGMSVKQIANRRGLTEKTILGHLEKLVRRGDELDLEYLKPPIDQFNKIKNAFEKSGDTRLSPVREILGDDYSYDELRVVRLFLKENMTGK